MAFKFFQKFRSRKAYSISEYMLVIVLVIAGIMLMSRYIFRSWHANLKGWEDAVIDSYQDPLVQGPDIPIEGCNCSPWSQICGPLSYGPNDSIPCPVYHYLETRTCIPGGCDLEFQCSAGPIPPEPPDFEGCCNRWTFVACGPNCAGFPTGACPIGEACAWRYCGGDTSNQLWACLPMPPDPGAPSVGSDPDIMNTIDHVEQCKYVCTGDYGYSEYGNTTGVPLGVAGMAPPLGTSTIKCPDDYPPSTATTNLMTWYIDYDGVAAGQCSPQLSNDRPCEVECLQGEFLMPGGVMGPTCESCVSLGGIPDPNGCTGTSSISGICQLVWGWAPPVPSVPPIYNGPWACDECNDIGSAGYLDPTHWCNNP